MNTCIAFCIPTYNRSRILNEALKDLITIASPFNIPIYISDNASTDETEAVVIKSKDIYPFIFYKKNSSNIGMDRNFESALKMPSASHIWLLGDDDRVQANALEAILKILIHSSHDVLILNGGYSDPKKGRVIGRPSRTYNDPGELLQDIGWHMTWISGLILSKPLINELNFKKYYGTFFSHFGSIFEALAERKSISVYWHQQCSFYPSSSAVFSWTPRIFEIFSEKWTNVVRSLPYVYSVEAKNTCILAHSTNTGLFSPIGLINLRSKGAISPKQVSEFESSLRVASQTNIHIIYIIASLPIWVLRIPRSIYVLIRKLINA